MSENKPIVGASVLVRNDEGEVLLVKRLREPGKNLWAFPGGKVEPGETVEETAVREIKEETNISTKLDKLIGAYDIIGEDYHYVTICYLGESKNSNIVSSSEVGESKWFPVEKLGEIRLSSTTKSALFDVGIL